MTELLKLVSASNGIIGYTSSLKAGDVVSQGYIDRLNDWYVKNLGEAVEALTTKARRQ